MASKRVRSLIFSTFILLGLIVINFIIQVGVDPSYNNMSTDSGTFAYCGQVIRDGGLMYRDCWDNKPPGIYYLNALAIWLAGSNPFAIWLLQAIWLIITVLIFYFVMNHIWENQGLAALGSVVLLLVELYPGIFQGGNFTETYAILPGVISLGAFWAFLRSGARRWLIVIGISTAVGFLLKPTYISVGLSVTAILIYLGLRQRRYKSMLAHLITIGISTVLPLVLVALYWVLKHDFYELWFAVFSHNLTYIQQSFSLSSLYGTARMFLIQQPMASLTILFLTSILAFVSQYGQMIFERHFPHHDLADQTLMSMADSVRARGWFLCGVVIAAVLDVIFLASSGKNFGHYLQVLVPGMVIGLIYLVDFLYKSYHLEHLGRNSQIIALSAVIIVSLGGGLEIAGKELPNVQALKTFFSTPAPAVYQPTELEQYIIDHSSSSDKVLIWAGHPGMNFVTQRRSPTRYIFLLHLFSPTAYGPNGFPELMQELNLNPPKLIVSQPVSSMGLPDITSSSAPVCTGCDQSVLAGLVDLHQFIVSRYQLSYSIWDWVIYSRIH
jgi:hypothetical protein